MVKSVDSAFISLIEVYLNYSVFSDDERTMRKRNLKELIQNEMNVGPILQKPEYQSLMADLDRNEDEIVNFAECVEILRRVLVAEGRTSN